MIQGGAEAEGGDGRPLPPYRPPAFGNYTTRGWHWLVLLFRDFLLADQDSWGAMKGE